MKKLRILFFSLFLFPLCSCDFLPILSSDTTVSEKKTENSDSSSASKADLVTVFSINDVHGSLKENAQGGELGLAKLEYAIKQDPDYDPRTSLIISCGDSWQGGYLSYKEKTITDELLSMVGVEAMALGNHEFDWGIDTIKTMKQASPFPFLACNIRNQNGGHTNELSENSVTIDKAGVRIGLIGAMGGNQESSIATKSLAGYSFDTRTSLIQEEITKLQGEDCDLILLAVHDSSESNYVNSIANTFDTTQIQGIFGGHTHTFESEVLGTGKIPFVQGGCNTKGYAKMSFSVKNRKEIDHSFVRAFSSYYHTDVSKLNQDIVRKIEEADGKYNGSEELCTLEGDFRRRQELNKFVPEIMLKQAINYGYHGKNELIALHNLSGIRADLSSGTLTREALFKVEPFENNVKIIKGVAGSKIASLIGTVEGRYSTKYYAYMRESDEAFVSDKTYDVVTIDFVSEGTYGLRAFGNATQYDLRKEKPYILDVMIDYLQNSESKVYKASDYR